MNASPTCDNPTPEVDLMKVVALLFRIMGNENSLQSVTVWEHLPGKVPSFRLTLKHQKDSVFTDFTRDELQNRQLLQVKLSRLWGDLLKIRNDRQHQNVQAISGQMVGTQEGN